MFSENDIGIMLTFFSWHQRNFFAKLSLRQAMAFVRADHEKFFNIADELAKKRANFASEINPYIVKVRHFLAATRMNGKSFSIQKVRSNNLINQRFVKTLKALHEQLSPSVIVDFSKYG